MRHFILVVVCFFALGTAFAAAPTRTGPSVNRPVPLVALPDLAGQTHALTEWQGKPFVLFFFCGCRPCHDCAGLWAQAQQAGELRKRRSGEDLVTKHPAMKHPATVVVFLGNGPEAKQFLAETGLAPAETRLLTDPSDQAGQKYGVVLCPRVFVVNAAGRLAYSNFEGGGRQLPAAVLVSRVLTAWRRLPDPVLPLALNKAHL